MHKNVKKKMHFLLQLMIHLPVPSRGAPEGTYDCVLKDALRVMGACEIALKGALEIPFELHLWLHLLMQQLMDKFLQNSSSNCEPDALEGALRGELNVEFARAPYSTL